MLQKVGSKEEEWIAVLGDMREILLPGMGLPPDTSRENELARNKKRLRQSVARGFMRLQ
jgi:hypothetical protein